MESSTITSEPGALDTSAPGAKGLKPDALGYISNLVIAIASTAPAYSLAATLGFIVAVTGIGVHAPAVLIVAFIPILFVSVGYRFLNLADPDAGTTFAWTTRAFGPQIGWINGWAIFLADIIVMASLAAIAANYTFLLFGWHAAANRTSSLIVGAVLWIARDDLDLLPGDRALGSHTDGASGHRAVHAHAVRGRRPDQGLRQQSGRLDPRHRLVVQPLRPQLGAAGRRFAARHLHLLGLGLGVAVNEESRDRHRGPGKAAVVSTLILLLIYVVVAAAAQAYHGTHVPRRQFERRPERPRHGRVRIAARQAADHHGPDLRLGVDADDDPAHRPHDAVDGEVGLDPEAFGRDPPALPHPTFSTVLMGALSIVWTVALLAFNPNQDVLGDTISALGFAVCFYYGFTGLACAVYFRRDLFKSARNFFLAGLIPVVGGIMMAYVAIKAYSYYNTAGNNYSKPFIGIQTPIFVGIGGLILGVILMFASWPFFPSSSADLVPGR